MSPEPNHSTAPGPRGSRNNDIKPHANVKSIKVFAAFRTDQQSTPTPSADKNSGAKSHAVLCIRTDFARQQIAQSAKTAVDAREKKMDAHLDLLNWGKTTRTFSSND